MNIFINPITQSILEEEGLDSLIPSHCHGYPCVAYKNKLHIYNESNDIQKRVAADYLDHDLLLKLTGKSN